jgi:hypothetical protein
VHWDDPPAPYYTIYVLNTSSEKHVRQLY